MMPRFSVVIPTRGDTAYLRCALASALLQGPDIEVLVAHGTDATLPSDLFADRRVVPVATPSRTPGARRNAALAKARAPLVAFLDDDDLWLEGHLAAAADALEGDSSLVAIASDAWLFTDDSPGGTGEPPRDLRALPRFLGPGPAFEPTAGELLVRNVVLTPGVVARLPAVLASGGFDEALPAMEDWDLWIRLVRYGRVRVIREPSVIVRRRPVSASRDLKSMASSALEVARRATAAGTTMTRRERRNLLGRLWHDLAYACLCADDAKGARHASCRAIGLRPGRAKNYLYWFAGVGPKALRRSIFGARQSPERSA